MFTHRPFAPRFGACLALFLLLVLSTVQGAVAPDSRVIRVTADGSTLEGYQYTSLAAAINYANGVPDTDDKPILIVVYPSTQTGTFELTRRNVSIVGIAHGMASIESTLTIRRQNGPSGKYDTILGTLRFRGGIEVHQDDDPESRLLLRGCTLGSSPVDHNYSQGPAIHIKSGLRNLDVYQCFLIGGTGKNQPKSDLASVILATPPMVPSSETAPIREYRVRESTIVQAYARPPDSLSTGPENGKLADYEDANAAVILREEDQTSSGKGRPTVFGVMRTTFASHFGSETCAGCLPRNNNTGLLVHIDRPLSVTFVQVDVDAHYRYGLSHLIRNGATGPDQNTIGHRPYGVGTVMSTAAAHCDIIIPKTRCFDWQRFGPRGEDTTTISDKALSTGSTTIPNIETGKLQINPNPQEDLDFEFQVLAFADSESTAESTAEMRLAGFNASDSTTPIPRAAVYLDASKGDPSDPAGLSAGDLIGELQGRITGGTPGEWNQAATVGFQAAGTSSETSSPGRIVFGTTPSSSTTPVERMRIQPDGRVGIGTTTPDERLHVDGNAKVAGNAVLGGTLAVTGDTTISGNLTVPSSGRLLPSGSGASSVRIGPGTTAASGDYSVGLGQNAKAESGSAIAIGRDSTATAQDSAIAIGRLASAQHANAVALGKSSSASASNTLAIGNGAQAGNSSSLAIGQLAATQADYALAIGSSAVGAGTSSIAIGRDSDAQGNSSVVLGQGAETGATGAVAIGYQNKTTGISAVALGYQAEALAGYAVAAGRKSIVNQEYGTAIGYHTAVSDGGWLAIGGRYDSGSGQYWKTSRAIHSNSASILGGVTRGSGEFRIGGPALGATTLITGPEIRLLTSQTSSTEEYGRIYMSGGRMYVQDSQYNQTIFSPHASPAEIEPTATTSFSSDSGVKLPWSFHHRNAVLGIGATIDMAKLVQWAEAKMQAELGAESGRLVYEFDLPADERVAVHDVEARWLQAQVDLLPAVEVQLLVGNRLPPEAIEEIPILEPAMEEYLVHRIDWETDEVIVEVELRPTGEMMATGQVRKRLREGYFLENGRLYRRPTIHDINPATINLPEMPVWIQERLAIATAESH